MLGASLGVALLHDGDPVAKTTPDTESAILQDSLARMGDQASESPK